MDCMTDDMEIRKGAPIDISTYRELWKNQLSVSQTRVRRVPYYLFKNKTGLLCICCYSGNSNK